MSMQTSTGGTAGGQKRDIGVEECINNCLECYRVCTQTVPSCLQMGGKHSEANHITLLVSCANICQVSANFMLIGSPLHMHVCRACAEVCKECADDCNRLADDQQMKWCADVCKRCAESCRQMAAH